MQGTLYYKTVIGMEWSSAVKKPIVDAGVKMSWLPIQTRLLLFTLFYATAISHVKLLIVRVLTFRDVKHELNMVTVNWDWDAHTSIEATIYIVFPQFSKSYFGDRNIVY